jgi:anaerobic selenocysteine-containing dehydrogenase
MPRTVYRQCTLCEAHCGIRAEVSDGRVTRITGDPDDVMSKGYICPKAAALIDIHEDPDRLRRPVRREGDRFVEIDWDEAIDLAAKGLRTVQDRHGKNALATYIGNPAAHSSAVLAAALLRKLLGSANNYSATSADQLPQHLVALEMFGHFALIPVPDIDRTDHMLILGANPAVSNGSIMTAPGVRQRIRAIRERGGAVVVVDPRRTETAAHATEHVSIRPGGDPYLLLGMLHTIFAERLADLDRLRDRVAGVEELQHLAEQWTPERAAEPSGVPAATISRLAREFAMAPSAVAYGRVGVCQQTTGSVTHWLINCLNAVTGNFDRPGGQMFTTPAVDLVALLELLTGRGKLGHTRQRTTGLPSLNDELPVAGLAQEILTPGAGQVRGMLVYAGNPVLSTPNGKRLGQAMEQLEWCVAIDMYVTETSRHAHVILPPASQLERSDIDLVLPAFAARNYIRYNPAALPTPPEARTDWQILMALAQRIGRGAPGALQNRILGLTRPFSTPERVADLALRLGPYGPLRRGRAGLGIGRIKKARHGIDLGALEPRLPGILRTPGKRIRLAPPALLGEAEQLATAAAERTGSSQDGYDLTLIGRRQLRSNNSWMHNSRRLMKGADRCTALLHPDDAAARGLEDGQRVRLTSRVGQIELPLQISDEMRPGVVSVPHGFGHDRPGVSWRLAASHPGASINDLTDPDLFDSLSGNAAFNAVRVRLEPAPAVQDDLSRSSTVATAAT